MHSQTPSLSPSLTLALASEGVGAWSVTIARTTCSLCWRLGLLRGRSSLKLRLSNLLGHVIAATCHSVLD